MLPFIRAFTSIVSGLIRVPAGRFGVLSLIGTVIYATALSLIGYGLGSAWQKVNHGLTLAGYALFVIVVVAIVAFVVYRLRQFRREAAQGKLAPEFAAPGAAAPGAAAPGAAASGAAASGSVASYGAGEPAAESAPVPPGRARHAAPRSDA